MNNATYKHEAWFFICLAKSVFRNSSPTTQVSSGALSTLHTVLLSSHLHMHGMETGVKSFWPVRRFPRSTARIVQLLPSIMCCSAVKGSVMYRIEIFQHAANRAVICGSMLLLTLQLVSLPISLLRLSVPPPPLICISFSSLCAMRRNKKRRHTHIAEERIETRECAESRRRKGKEDLSVPKE